MRYFYKSIKALSVIIVFMFIFQAFAACTNTSNDKSEYEEKADSITNTLIEYNKDYDPLKNDIVISIENDIVKDIEKLTDCQYEKDLASGRLIMQFRYDEHMYFIVEDVPITAVTFYVDDNVIKSYDFTKNENVPEIIPEDDSATSAFIANNK